MTPLTAPGRKPLFLPLLIEIRITVLRIILFALIVRLSLIQH